MKKYIMKLLLSVVSLLSACSGSLVTGQGWDMSNTDVPYLQEVIPPCIIVEMSSIDPCAPKQPSHVETVSIAAYPPLWPWTNQIPTFDEILLMSTNFVPHIVIRGTAQTNSTRCELYPVKNANYLPFDNEEWTPENGGLFHYHCFVDITVQEYIVGTGPPVITASLHREVTWLYEQESIGILDQNGEVLNTAKNIIEIDFNRPETRTALAYEGKEMILFLTIPDTVLVEAWDTVEPGGFHIWFVQKNEDGIRAVAQDIADARTEDQRQKLTLPLDEMIQDIKQAASNRILKTEGRIGENPTLPLLVTDANNLRNYYTAIGAVYNSDIGSTVLPPPVPGAEDPSAPTIPTNEGTTAPSVPAPGEEPTVTSLADDATAVTTSTTTSTLAPTSTTIAITTTTDPVVTTSSTTTTNAESASITTATTASSTSTTSAEGVTTTTAFSSPTSPEDETSLPPANGNANNGEEITTTLPANDNNIPGASTTLPSEEGIIPSGGDQVTE